MIAIYFRSLSAFFFEDDFQWLASLHAFRVIDVLTPEAHYRPIFEFYWWVGSLVFGRSPVAFHAASIFIHIVNGWLIFAIASRLGMTRAFAFLTALLFVVQPAYVAAVAWVGAVAEALVVLFGCASLLAFFRFRDSGSRRWIWLAVLAFAMALLAHESAIVFVPILMLADRVMRRDAWRWPSAVRMYWPFAGVAAAYLALTFTVNTSAYLTEDIGYSFGPHIITNVFEYIASLYVGERKLASHLIVAAVLIVILAVGTPRARLGVAWMILGILPFAPFHIANISRYAYIPAIGLAFLLAEGLAALHDRLSRRSFTVARVAVAVLALGIVVRFSYFARDGVKDMFLAAERYRTFLADLRHKNPELPNNAVVFISPEQDALMARRFVQSAVEWEYRNPTLRVEVRR